MKNKKQAFTLVELIVVITILAILGTIAFINLQGYSGSARDSKRESDISNILKKVSVEQIKGVTGGELIDNQLSKSVVINGITTNAIQGTPKFLQLKEDGNSFKDPTTKADYVLSYAKGGTSTGAYNFLQIATINEERNEAVVKGNYYMYNSSTDSPSIVKNASNLFVVDGGSQLPYEISGNNIVVSNPFSSGWTNFTTSNSSLPFSKVRGITSDGVGNLWFATYGGGVVKFDGTNMQIYNTGNGFPNNEAKSIIRDSSGNIWVGSKGGLSKFDGTSWTTFNTSNGLLDNFVRALDIDSSGNFWLGTGGGVSKFNPTSNTWVSYTTGNSGLSGNVINGIKVSTDGNIWIGLYGGGVSKFNPTSNTWITYNTGNSGLSNNTINGINQDSNGNIWIGTDGGGISKFDPTGNTWITFTTPDLPAPDGIYVNSSMQDSDGNIWIGSWGGAVKYNQSTFTQYTNNLTSNNIYTVYNDSNGNIWFGTTGGVSVYNPN
ncbi:MAG: two-component regulator propeller domain-containing protein [Candidatus Gracilibacteria bacterium]|nr:two-component regulator propeller domain-containing protein [Candidatus Gracilibacteria bacterium]